MLLIFTILLLSIFLLSDLVQCMNNRRQEELTKSNQIKSFETVTQPEEDILTSYFITKNIFCQCCGMQLRGTPAERECKEKLRAKKNWRS